MFSASVKELIDEVRTMTQVEFGTTKVLHNLIVIAHQREKRRNFFARFDMLRGGILEYIFGYYAQDYLLLVTPLSTSVHRDIGFMK